MPRGARLGAVACQDALGGYGLVSEDVTSVYYIFYHSVNPAYRTLTETQKVRFDVVPNPLNPAKGQMADNISKA